LNAIFAAANNKEQEQDVNELFCHVPLLIIVDLLKINRFRLKNLFEDPHFKEDLTVFDNSGFFKRAIELFRYQATENPLYKDFLKQLSVDPLSVSRLQDIPFLPISFFKSHQVKTGEFIPESCFESSGTTTTQNSKHYVKNTQAYLNNAEALFKESYGELDKYCILALLPSYLERTNSSLVCMADYFIKKSKHPESGFYLTNYEELHNKLLELEASKQPTLLIGVTFALIDFVEKYPMKLKYTIIMETGGMKGRKKEITRAELHLLLATRFGVEKIHAEYGMTELLSQAYSHGDGLFKIPSTMKVLLRALDDPFDVWTADDDRGQAGVINIIDLANEDSIAFIATDDLGTFNTDGSFSVTGRVDKSDIRGCSLLAV
jgi:hypothetical protein